MSLATLLQIIISLVFIYLILSLIVSELQEQLTAFLEFRARNLKKAIEIFLGKQLAEKLYKPDTNSLFSAYNQYTNQWKDKSPIGIPLFGKSLGPSYIDPKVFAESLVTLVNEQLSDENKLQLNDLLVYASENSAVSRKGVIAKLQTIEETIKDDKVFVESLVTLVNEKLSDENKLQLNRLLAYINENSAVPKKEVIAKLQTIKETIKDDQAFAESLVTLVNEKLSDENKLQLNDSLVYDSENLASDQSSRKGVIAKLQTIKDDNEYKEVIPKLIEIANLTKLKYNQPTLTNFIDEVATTFTQIMERTSGVYKRNAKGISLLFGLFAASLFNIDTLYIVDQLYKNPVLRDSLDAAATKVVEQNQTCFDSARKLTKPEEITAAEQKCEESLQSNADTLKTSSDFPPLPVGWKDGTIGNFDSPSQSLPTAFLGWLISAIAISMGAPFWFDLLSNVINVRNTIKPVTPPTKPVDK